MHLKVLVDVPGDSARIISAIGTPTGNQPATQPTTRGVQPREGTLTFLDNTVQNGTGTVKLRATVPNSDRYFWPGQFVNVRLVLTMRKDAELIPVIAQQISQQGPFVYVVKADNTAEMRPIKAGQQQGDLLVVDGVNVGEKVVTVGQMMVQPGAPVQVLPAQGAAPAQGGAPAQGAAAPAQGSGKPPVDQTQAGQAGPPQLRESAGSPAGGSGGGATAGGAGH
jgi:multidrug efflux system membrane fusion protein